jgi:hypothetical protein
VSKRKQLVGFYRELPHGLPTAPSLRAAATAAAGRPHPDAAKIAVVDVTNLFARTPLVARCIFALPRTAWLWRRACCV